MKAEKRARRALFSRIERLASKADVAEVKDLAEAFAKVKFGAQGHTYYDYDQTIRREQAAKKEVGFQ